MYSIDSQYKFPFRMLYSYNTFYYLVLDLTEQFNQMKTDPHFVGSLVNIALKIDVTRVNDFKDYAEKLRIYLMVTAANWMNTQSLKPML